MSNPSSKLPTQASPAPLCFPAATDQLQPPLPRTQPSAQTRTFHPISSRSSSSLGCLPFSSRLLWMPRGCHLVMGGLGQLEARALIPTSAAPAKRGKPLCRAPAAPFAWQGLGVLSPADTPHSAQPATRRGGELAPATSDAPQLSPPCSLRPRGRAGSS